MRRLLLLIALFGVVIGAGLALAQEGEDAEPVPPFDIIQEIGRALPRQIIYDPNFEQYAVVDAYGRLVLMDALTFDVEHVLYTFGNYNDLQFSNDGRWLALAISQRIELFDTATGEEVAQLDTPNEAIRVNGPLTFNADDRVLVFRTVNPAPRSIREFEGQTIEYPWLWYLPAARNEEDSPFRGRVEALPYFDFPFGFELGPDNRIVAALQGRVQVIDALESDVLYDIQTTRFEQEPLRVLFSARDNQIYLRPNDASSLIQVDTQRGELAELPFFQEITTDDLSILGGVELSQQARVIGGEGHTDEIPLLEVWLGDNYFVSDRYNGPLTVTLIDLLVPPASTGDNIQALLFIYNERDEEGRFELRSGRMQQAVLSPDEQTMLVRADLGNGERIIEFDLTTGAWLSNMTPSLRDIGRYSRQGKNRVLAYSADGSVIISDFQRIDVETFRVTDEDLRYARAFDRFFFTEDRDIVTLSGDEWRLWDAETAEVVRREVLNYTGEIVATSNDGYRYLSRDSRFGDATMQVTDLSGGDINQQEVTIDRVRGADVSAVYWNDAWTRFLVTYSDNQYGPYFPGNQLSMYHIEDGQLWFMAGDDLPPPEARSYNWVDDETVVITGSGTEGSIPDRIFGVDYAPNALPQCVVDAFPDQVDEYVLLWERLNYFLRGDDLNRLSQSICENLPATADGVTDLLIPTATPPFATPTPPRRAGVPVCLTGRYPDQADAYAEAWERMTADLSAEQIEETERLICLGIGDFTINPAGAQSDRQVMFINAQGVRSIGDYSLPPERISRPTGPIRDLFEDVMRRSLGTFILGPREEWIAASNLPGELVIYALPITYEQITAPLTATAQSVIATEQFVRALPSATPTFDPVGTARPTLTPTITPIFVPRPDRDTLAQDERGQVENFCPSETLYTIDNLPPDYAPTGRLQAPFSGENLWAVEPEDGRRYQDETIPRCDGDGSITCSFSPDGEWVLARDDSFTPDYALFRPDGSDYRDYFIDYPFSTMRWSGVDTIEYEVELTLTDEDGDEFTVMALQRDILGTEDDPPPWVPDVEINQIPATIVSRQPGGPWVVVYTTYSTGVSPGYKYYLYNIETEEDIYFARRNDRNLLTNWHPHGDWLDYNYDESSGGRSSEWYRWDFETMTNRFVGENYSGTYSNDGRYVAFRRGSDTQPIGVYDTETGLVRTYCLPETGTRRYDGAFHWAPDGRYIALRTFLPEDENEEGVGQHILILDTETGAVVDLTTGAGPIIIWAREPGDYGG
jgi:hypothetical protein